MIGARIAARWRSWVGAVRRIAGIPDYEAYVAHLRAHHPERAIPSRAEFFAERQRTRHGAGTSRCC